MRHKTNIKLNLNDSERQRLRQNKIKKADVLDYAVDELEALLQVSTERAREIYALADFQSIPTVGIKFAEDLIFLGYYRLDELYGKDGAALTDEYEKKKGFRTDVCVEDQFRLVAHFAVYHDHTKKWWDFTAERKQFRSEFGYPKDRPKIEWYEVEDRG